MFFGVRDAVNAPFIVFGGVFNRFGEVFSGRCLAFAVLHNVVNRVSNRLRDLVAERIDHLARDFLILLLRLGWNHIVLQFRNRDCDAEAFNRVLIAFFAWFEHPCEQQCKQRHLQLVFRFVWRFRNRNLLRFVFVNQAIAVFIILFKTDCRDFFGCQLRIIQRCVDNALIEVCKQLAQGF